MRAGSTAVARHYDELDELYRSIWGERLHHGLFTSGDEGTEQATLALLQYVTAPLNLDEGCQMLDVGCGYGADARWLAESYGAHVTGITLSSKQAHLAQSNEQPPRGSVSIQQGDYLEFNESPFDAVVSLETVDHIENKSTFFAQMSQQMKPGGQAAITCWTAPRNPSFMESLLLQTLCREGHLPRVPSFADYQEAISQSSLRLRTHQDLTEKVSPTWSRITQQALALPFRHPTRILSLLAALSRRPTLTLPIPLMIVAYHLGVLRYHLFHCERPK